MFLNPTINNSTISGNTAPGISIGQGGGIYAQEGLTLNNTIVSGNTAHTGPNTATNSGRVINQNHSLIGGTPLLAPFGDYGSATILPGGGHLQTYALLPGSPAIDAGDAPTCAALPGGDLDQRGQARVGTCDIGAFESQGFTFSSPTGSGQSAVRSTAFAQPLTVTIAANNASEPVAGGVVTFTGPPTGASIQPVTVTATITSGIASASVTANGTAGPYTVTATASGVPSATPTTFTLTNFAPITLTPASPLPGGTVGTPSTATFVATGGTNSGFTYAVTVGTPPPGLTLNAATGVLSGTPTAQGTSTFTVTATDDGTHTGSLAYSLTIAKAATTTTVTNQSAIDSTSDQSVTLSAAVAINPTSTMIVNTGTITFKVFNGATQVGATASSGTVSGGTGTASYTLPGGTPPGVYTIAATYNPGADYLTSSDATHTLTVTPGPTTQFTVSGYTTPTVAGVSHSFTVTAQDALGVTTPAYTGTIHFTSSDAQAAFATNDVTLTSGIGSFSATLKTVGAQTITATDGGITGSQSAIQVTPAAANAITVMAGDAQSATAGSTFATNLQAKVTDFFGNVVPTVSVTFIAPGNNASGTFAAPGNGTTASVITDPQGIATAPALTANFVAGSNTVTARVAGVATPATFTLTNLAPTITLSALSPSTATVGVVFPNQTITASGGTAAYTFAVTNGALPAGLTLNTTGLLHGTPTGVGPFSFTVTATDASTGTGAPYTGSGFYTGTVATPTITLSPTSLPGGVKTQAYPAQTLTASGGVAPTTFAVTTGALPAGLTLNSTTGVLSGTPTATGTATFTVTATDHNGFTGSQSYTLTITAAPLTSIALTCGSTPATVPAGGTLQCTVTGTYADGATQDLTSQVTYASDNTNMAAVDGTGKITAGPLPGTATITVTMGAVTQHLVVTVTPPGGKVVAPDPRASGTGGSTPSAPDSRGSGAPAAPPGPVPGR